MSKRDKLPFDLALTGVDFDEIWTPGELRAELAKRKVAQHQAQRGQSIEEVRARCAGSLIEFVRMAWQIVEPGKAYIHSWHLELIAAHLEAVTRGELTRLLVNIPPGSMKSLMISAFWPAWEWGPQGLAAYRYIATSFALDAVTRDSRRMRDIVTSDWYKAHWPEVELIRFGEMSYENTMKGWREASAFGSLTSKRGDRLIIDDPHSVRTAESVADRKKAGFLFREAAINRLNNQVESAIVVVMQRLHEDDVSGVILDGNMGFTHLMLPMEFEPERKCETPWGEDIRTVDKELLAPDRFPPQAIAELKNSMTSYAWCTPAETPILMADLSLRPISEIKEGDEIVGIRMPNNNGKENYRRRRLTKTVVHAVSRSRRSVVRITLSSGRVIRCTADHKWMRKSRPGRPEYLPARIGSPMIRICDPEIPSPRTMEEARDLGWLAGFFDGEGSVSLMKKQGGDFPASSCIQFTQGADRNLPICERFEAILARCGFDFGWQLRYGHSSVNSMQTPKRYYWLRGNDLPMFQRFLHLVRPTKWRDRMIDGALGTKFAVGYEKVVKIEPDTNDEDVFGLTTGTGNYVAWGLASQNSGQYQQRPMPRGGGVFPYNSWEFWDKALAEKYGKNEDQFPDMEIVVGSVDTAYTEKKENDYSAMVVLGVWRDMEGYPQVMLMYFWQKRLAFHDLSEEIVATGRRLKIDKLLIEDKAAGRSVVQELMRLTREEDFTIHPRNPGAADKTARAHSVSGFHREEREDGTVRPGMVYVPMKTQPDGAVWPRHWADSLMSQCVVAGTLIFTERGVLPVEEVGIGDSVLTHRGRFRPVLAKSRRWAADLIGIQAKTLDQLILTPEHPFYAVQLTSERTLRGGQGGSWVAACDMTPRRYADRIREGRVFREASPSSCHAAVLPIIRRENPIDAINLEDWISFPATRRYARIGDDETLASTHFKGASFRPLQPLDSEFGFILGLYLAEGSASRRSINWSLNPKTETALAERVKAFIADRMGMEARITRSPTALMVYVGQALLAQFFAEFGGRAHLKTIPAWMWDAPDAFLAGLLDGWLTGDGHEDRNDRIIGTTVSPSLAWGMRMVGLRIGLAPVVRKGKAGIYSINGRTGRRRAAYTLNIRKDGKNKGASFAFSDAEGDFAAFSVMEKGDVAGGAEVFNFDVAEDHSYVTTGGAVHNCASFPKGKHDDGVDAYVQGLIYLRQFGLVRRRQEEAVEEQERLEESPIIKPLY